MIINTIAAYVRKNVLSNFGEGVSSVSIPHMSPRGELIMSAFGPAYMELVRQGQSYTKMTDAVACVTALPTTTAAHTLWNGEPAGGKTLVVDHLSWFCTTSAAAASSFAMLACLNILPVATVPATSDTATAIGTLNGRVSPSKAKSSHTVTVVNDGWVSIGQTFTTALTATVGSQLDVALPSAFLVPPGCTLDVSVLAVNATALGRVTFFWHELLLDSMLS